jgi:mRNA interferase MazF
MTEGDVALTPIPQVDGRTKPRPAILLRQTPPFGDWLICGVSTQLHQDVTGVCYNVSRRFCNRTETPNHDI